MRKLFLFLILLAAIAHSLPVRAQTVPLDESVFTDYVAGLLRKELGNNAVVIDGPLILGLGSLEASLDRIYAFCKREKGICEAEVGRFVKGAAAIYKDQNIPPQREWVRLVIRSSQYVRAAQSSGGGHTEQIQSRPFSDGLVSIPVLDSPRAMRMLGSKVNAQLGLSEVEIHELGLRNLRATLPPLMQIAKVAASGQIGSLIGDSYDPSRLLLHDTWEPLANAQGGTLIVAIPATDIVYYIGEDSPTAIDALRVLTKNELSRAPNGLSDVLLRWTRAGWVPVK